MTNKDRAIKLLGEKKDCNPYGALIHLNSAHSYNEMHSKAVLVVTKLLEMGYEAIADNQKIEELKKERDRILIRENYYKKQIDELHNEILDLKGVGE